MSRVLRRGSWAVAIALAGIGSVAWAAETVTLAGSNEVPPVTTSASGTANVTVGADGAVKATVTVKDMKATASHIHDGAAGANGPVIVPLAKTGDNTFSSADGAKLTEAQMKAYKAGSLYVNVHSDKNAGGEIRGQLMGS